MSIRILLVIVLFLSCYSIIVFKLFYWQVIRHDEITSIALAQSTETFDVPSRRGEIFSSDRFALVSNTLSYLLYANPKLIPDKNAYVSKLSNMLSIDSASISSSLSKDLFWVKLKNNLDSNKKKEIEALQLKGLGFQDNSIRYYPEGSMSAHLLGFLGKDESGNDKGYFGIEGYYDKQLAGRNGKLHVIHDGHGNTILNDIREEKKIDGRSFLLSLDRTIEFIAEKKLKEGIDEYNADGGSVVIMEVKSGKILAMASLPKFDPKTYYEYETSTYKNPVITNLYEPGSTFKVLVMASGIDKNLVKPETICDNCSAPVAIGEYTIKTWNNKYMENPTMTDVIVHSDNTGMVFVGRKLGVSSMVSYLKSFGIGKITGIDLEGEITGVVKDEKDWSPIDLATASFGQGISVTPLQLLTAVNSIANRGEMVAPSVVSEIITDDNKKIEIKPKNKGRVISETTAKVVTEMMVAAVEKGEAKWTKLKNYKIAGKTGTAQIPLAGHYDPNSTIASFIGFFPADDPKVSMLVLINKPKKSIYGAETAAPIFFNIAKELVNYYAIPPTY